MPGLRAGRITKKIADFNKIIFYTVYKVTKFQDVDHNVAIAAIKKKYNVHKDRTMVAQYLDFCYPWMENF